MSFKKIYLEITNRCNLNCPFCIKNKRLLTDINKENYEYIISKIKPYTKELYLHILGEPLIHPEIPYFIHYATKNGLMVNITTNGYLIDKIKNNRDIHRLNISLHSFNESYGISIDKYLDNIFEVIDSIKSKTFVTLRLWVNNKNTKYILKRINEQYNTNIDKLNKQEKIKISSNLIIDTFHEFIWPDLNNNYYSETGKCKGLIDHLGILSNGTIIPCCLDSNGIINLGNIYEDNLEDILNSKRVKEIVDGFKKGYKCEELCRHCNFLD